MLSYWEDSGRKHTALSDAAARVHQEVAMFLSNKWAAPNPRIYAGNLRSEARSCCIYFIFEFRYNDVSTNGWISAIRSI